MTIVQWSDDYKTGEKEIDQEHWGLFALVNDLSDKMSDGAPVKSIASTIDALVAYVDVHFEHEERLMAEKGYPKLESHKQAHAALGKRVEEFHGAFQRNPETFDFIALMDFLSTWLKQHILNLDMDFAAFNETLQSRD